jgi:FtsH-binding integral membrane protein
MKLWLLIALVLTLQEGLTVLAVLVHAYQLHYSLIGITAVWLVVTVAQILFGYWLGKRIQRKFAGSKFELWVQKQAATLEKSIDKNGEKIALVLFASIISPGIGAFVASWLDISFVSIFFYSLLGDTFWYVSTIATVIGAEQILSKAKEGFFIVLVIVVIFVVISHFAKKKAL